MDRKLCKTEERNERTGNIDELSTIDMIRLINDEDKKVALAVEREAERISAAVDVIAGQLKAGGRLIYCGCGTSGRLGVLDAVECPPTYSTDPDMVVGLIAGGYDAMFRAVEGAEDDRALGEKDLRDIRFGREDVLVGIAAQEEISYNFAQIMDKEATIKSVFRYRNIYPKAIAAVASGAIDVESIVTHEFDLEHIQEAFDEAVNNKTDLIKAVIKIK